MTLLEKIEVSLMLGLCSAAGCFGCGFFKTASTPNKDIVQCYAKALEPAVGDVYDTVELAKDLVSGKAKMGALIGNLELDAARMATLSAAVQACGAQIPDAPPSPDAGVAS